MPIQLKKAALKKTDRTFRKWAVEALGATVIFGAGLIVLMSKIISTESRLLTSILFGIFMIYFASCIITCVVGIISYVKDDCTAPLFQGILSGAAAVTCLLNLRLSLVMLFSSFGKTSAITTLIGSTQTESDFVTSQYGSWIALCVGMVVMIVIGILGIVKLAKNKKR